MILQRYLLRELGQAFLLIFIVLFSVIIITGPFFKFYKEYQNVGAGFLADVLPYFVPQATSLIIPLSLLIASVFIFGRLSEDNEILAIRSSGLHLAQVAWPLLVLGIILSVLVGGLNIFVIPDALARTRLLTIDTFKNSIISPSLINRTIKLTKDYQIYYNDVRNNVLQDVSVAQMDKNGNLYQHIKAKEGELDFNDKTSLLTLQLRAASVVTWEKSGTNTFEPRVVPDTKGLNLTLDISGLLVPRPKNLSALSLEELNQMISENQTERFRLSELVVEKYRRFALSLTPLLFLLLGIPVGMIVHKGSKMAGVGISALIVFAGYFPLTIFANYLGETNRINPVLAVWLPSILVLLIGLRLNWSVLRK